MVILLNKGILGTGGMVYGIVISAYGSVGVLVGLRRGFEGGDERNPSLSVVDRVLGIIFYLWL